MKNIFKDISNFVEPPETEPKYKQNPRPTIKCCAAIRLIRDKLIEAKVDICDFFELERLRWSKKNIKELNPELLHKFLCLIYPYFEKDETSRIFKILDI